MGGSGSGDGSRCWTDLPLELPRPRVCSTPRPRTPDPRALDPLPRPLMLGVTALPLLLDRVTIGVAPEPLVDRVTGAMRKSI